jgi:hypothetical protein
MPQLLQGIQPRVGTVGVLAARKASNDKPIGLRRIDVQVLTLQALPAQQRDFRLQVAARATLALGLGQLQHDLLALTFVISPVGIIQVMIERHPGTACGTQYRDHKQHSAHNVSPPLGSVSTGARKTAAPIRPTGNIRPQAMRTIQRAQSRRKVVQTNNDYSAVA